MATMSSTERVKMQGLPGEEQKLHVFFATTDHPFGSRPCKHRRRFQGSVSLVPTGPLEVR